MSSVPPILVQQEGKGRWSLIIVVFNDGKEESQLDATVTVYW